MCRLRQSDNQPGNIYRELQRTDGYTSKGNLTGGLAWPCRFAIVSMGLARVQAILS